ncbi:hypothetical protein [Sabulicella rubraurantiaca]|uniref:hypothetical protein n=1 Tax=Sabulicella rubraurantiaca TaxID=2811429 RepID=UPI001A95E167|nr:hypothetical protein [Sabulicella rubraurantiaca]
MSSNQRALVELMRVNENCIGNLPSLPAIHPERAILALLPVMAPTRKDHLAVGSDAA